jgi:hypothetical protein
LNLLGARGWEGDEDLASQLEGVLGRGPALMLRPLKIDLEDLSGLLEGDPLWGGGRIDLDTGECWPAQVDVEGEDEDNDAGRWLRVPCEGSRDGYRDMELFIATVADPGLADRLEIAIAGRGAFRRFKDVLARSEAEYSRYHRFAQERQRGRARAWLAAHGYRPAGRRCPAILGPAGGVRCQPFARRWSSAVWRRPALTVRTACPRALREPTRTTSFLARVTAV